MHPTSLGYDCENHRKHSNPSQPLPSTKSSDFTITIDLFGNTDEKQNPHCRRATSVTSSSWNSSFCLHMAGTPTFQTTSRVHSGVADDNKCLLRVDGGRGGHAVGCSKDQFRFFLLWFRGKTTALRDERIVRGRWRSACEDQFSILGNSLHHVGGAGEAQDLAKLVRGSVVRVRKVGVGLVDRPPLRAGPARVGPGWKSGSEANALAARESELGRPRWRLGLAVAGLRATSWPHRSWISSSGGGSCGRVKPVGRSKGHLGPLGTPNAQGPVIGPTPSPVKRRGINGCGRRSRSL